MVVLGLGTNQGDRFAQLQRAVSACDAFVSERACSPVYESPALLPENAPAEWNVPFLNMAVAGNTALSPQALLDEIKAIEAAMGRTQRGHWGPREIDIDILAYGDHIVNEANLIVPHKELLVRDFALVPLAAVAPDWVHPIGQHTAQTLARAMHSTLVETDMVIR